MFMTFRRVLLIGASGGIGFALGDALAETDLTALSRSVDGLDLTDEASVAAIAARIEGQFDLIFDATGALEIDGIGPEVARRDRSEGDGSAVRAKRDRAGASAQALRKEVRERTPCGLRNSFGPRRLDRRRPPRRGWYGYRAAKAGLNQIVRTAAVEIARSRPQAIVLALHPGTVETALTANM